MGPGPADRKQDRSAAATLYQRGAGTRVGTSSRRTPRATSSTIQSLLEASASARGGRQARLSLPQLRHVCNWRTRERCACHGIGRYELIEVVRVSHDVSLIDTCIVAVQNQPWTAGSHEAECRARCWWLGLVHRDGEESGLISAPPRYRNSSVPAPPSNAGTSAITPFHIRPIAGATRCTVSDVYCER
jgi:hypothetical protein